MTAPTCKLCGRILTNPESIKNGIGPECIQRQQQFVAGCGTSFEEIASLTLLADPTVTRWIAKFAGAMKAKRADHGKSFLDAARRAARQASMAEAA